MDWTLAIERNRRRLVPILAQIFALLGIEGDGTSLRLPLQLRSAAFRLLRPAESAVRRLIVIAARGLVVQESEARARPAGRIIIKRGPTARRRRPSFQLFDPRKTFARVPFRCGKATRIQPRIHLFTADPRIGQLWQAAPTPAMIEETAVASDGLVSGARLVRRLEAARLALEDIPRQAKRLARWRAKRERDRYLHSSFVTPLRPGRPPGHRSVPAHAVDDILTECHRLALDAQRDDTS